jgi:hypothetical protein
VVAELEAELATPAFPSAIAHVWLAWRRLRRRKSFGMAGHNPIEWPDIDAFMRRTRVKLDPFEIELVEALDDVFLASMAEKPSDRDKQQALRDGLKAAEKR